MPIWRRCGESKERRAADPSPRKPDMIAPFELPLATVALQRETGQWHPASGTVPSLHVTSFAGSFHLPTLRGASGQATVGSAVCRWPARTERPALSGQASAEGGDGLEEARLEKRLGQARGCSPSLRLSAAPPRAHIGRRIRRQAGRLDRSVLSDTPAGEASQGTG